MKYKYTLTSDFKRYISGLKHVTMSCEWGSINYGYITIKKGYSWDGCTCAVNTKRTYAGCLIHDFLCQFKPISKPAIDLVFLSIMDEDNFEFAYLYYLAVRIFGWLF